MSKGLICAATEVVGCTASADCVRDTPDDFNLPVMFRIDLEKKTVESIRAGGEQRASAIGSVTQGEGFSILQGVDGGAGWSVVIDKTSGRMTVSSAHAGIAYSVFGTCVTL